jgi:hypothetical protein
MITSGMEDESERTNGELVALRQHRAVDGLAIDMLPPREPRSTNTNGCTRGGFPRAAETRSRWITR